MCSLSLKLSLNRTKLNLSASNALSCWRMATWGTYDMTDWRWWFKIHWRHHTVEMKTLLKNHLCSTSFCIPDVTMFSFIIFTATLSLVVVFMHSVTTPKEPSPKTDLIKYSEEGDWMTPMKVLESSHGEEEEDVAVSSSDVVGKLACSRIVVV